MRHAIQPYRHMHHRCTLHFRSNGVGRFGHMQLWSCSPGQQIPANWVQGPLGKLAQESAWELALESDAELVLESDSELVQCKQCLSKNDIHSYRSLCCNTGSYCMCPAPSPLQACRGDILHLHKWPVLLHKFCLCSCYNLQCSHNPSSIPCHHHLGSSALPGVPMTNSTSLDWRSLRGCR